MAKLTDGTGGGGMTAEDLQKHCDKLNNLNWVHASGKKYFVNKRESLDGSITHFVDR